MDSYLINHNSAFCSGCGACIQTCPKHCISFIEAEDGFNVPYIDQDSCVHCNRCIAVCPYSNPVCKNNTINAFSVKAKSIDAQIMSSSGGCFYGLARSVIDKGGIVCGAVLDNDYNCSHEIASNFNELIPLLGSKYIQSRCDIVFPMIREKLKTGQNVLFVGTPCQIAGLRNYLGKDYIELILVDIACHGVPSNKDFLECIRWIEKKHVGKLKYIKFRDKNHAGWIHSMTYTIEKNNSIKTYTVAPLKIPYYYFFLHSRNLRKSCYQCPYVGKERIGDITMADFWAAETMLSEDEIGKGISVALCNTEKGIDWIIKSCNYLNINSINRELAIKNNQPFVKVPQIYTNREKLLKEVLYNGYRNIRHYLGPKEFFVESIKAAIPEDIKRVLIRLLGDK